MTWKNLPVEPSPPCRGKDEYGTIGRPIKLRANHFKIKIGNPDLTLYHYDVTIKDCNGSSDIPKKKSMIIFEQMLRDNPNLFKDKKNQQDKSIGFDSRKNAYSTTLFPQFAKKEHTFTVTLHNSAIPAAAAAVGGNGGDERNKRSTYKVTMKKVNSSSLRDLYSAFSAGGGTIKEASNVIQMCEVMFRHYRARQFEQVSLRSFFSLNNEFGRPFGVSGSKEGQMGFFASLRPAAWKGGLLTLNIDTSFTAFHKDITILEFLKTEFNLGDRDFQKPLNPQLLRNAEKELKGLRIRTLHSPIPRTYKVIGITPNSASKQYFNKEVDNKGTKMSVKDYFSKDLHKQLQYPELNCLHVGNPARTNYIPIEFCKIDKGQRVVKKLNDMETREFIRSTAVPPAERLKRIQDIARKNNFPGDPILKSLTFTIDDKPLETNGRVLPAPQLIAANKKIVSLRDGKWMNNNYYKAAKLETWAVINYDSRTRDDVIQKFVTRLVQLGKQSGMNISPPFDIYTSRTPEPEKDFMHYKQQKNDLQLVMCVVSQRGIYGDIKLAGDRKCKLITQCVMGQNVFKCNDQTIRNLLLKMNAKMGGTHTVCGPQGIMNDIVFFPKPVLVMGADVNHPAAGDTSMPSLVAVVGSMDQCASRYSVEVRAQEHRTEIIMDMTEITMNLLKSFYKVCGKKPERIVMYRDGVSESQFQEVLSAEMNKMRKACENLEKGYKPGITFICVQKRHHTRLFCDEKDGVGRTRNVPPGTVVDRDITHPTENDFFLCSHEGIQGTSRPSHYHLLWDDSDININDLQMMTYKLCHVYSRCTRSVSIPTPAYYAHLAAFRAKTYAGAYIDKNLSYRPSDKEKERVHKEIKGIVNTTSKDKNTLYNELYYV